MNIPAQAESSFLLLDSGSRPPALRLLLSRIKLIDSDIGFVVSPQR